STCHASRMNPARLWHRSRILSASVRTRSRSRSASLRALSALISASVGKRTEDRFENCKLFIRQVRQVIGADGAGVLVALDQVPGELPFAGGGRDQRARLPLLLGQLPRFLELFGQRFGRDLPLPGHLLLTLAHGPRHVSIGQQARPLLLRGPGAIP